MREWEGEFGGERPQAMSDLIREVVDRRMARGMSDTQRATAVWYRVNGDRERRHTTGVFLKRPRVAGAAPIMGVYVDSHAMATDFGVNKDLYLARLANVGYMVSGIDFIVSRPDRRVRAEQSMPARGPLPEPLPELSADERREVEKLVEEVPEHLRASVSKAVTMSKRREKLEKSKNCT